MTAPVDSWRWPFQCTTCSQPYPSAGLPHECSNCGGHFDFSEPIKFADAGPTHEPGRGLGRFAGSFPLPPTGGFVSLGEGGTPLVPVEVHGRTLHFKCEFLNPTGSYKDRGTAVMVSALAAAGVKAAVEDSSGNAGASFAAYAARAGIRAKVFVPDYASGPKRTQIERYGAQVVRILGPRSAASQAVAKAAADGAVYASHAHLPHGLAGIATLAYELVDSMSQPPATVVAPVGQGTLLLGMWRGFQALVKAGRLDRPPAMVGVQALACAPLWAVEQGGAAGLMWTKERQTIAEGIRILRPLRGDSVLAAVKESGGRVMAVDEPDIIDGVDALSRRGLLVEPTSAVVWPALMAGLEELEDPVVAVLTGSGFKASRNGSG